MNIYTQLELLETEKSSIYERFLQIEEDLRVMYAAKEVYEGMKSNPQLQSVITDLLLRSGISEEKIHVVLGSAVSDADIRESDSSTSGEITSEPSVEDQPADSSN